ncbi:GFA family protein [Candidatus Pelagibacter sp.]|nr:GFA family protein [Candidatus Pelagibacter sp.]
MKKISLRASCLCGSVKIKTQGFHRNIQNCHCVQCMKTHGNYAAYAAVKLENVKFFKKKTLKWFKSSKKGRRGFCNKCGASMFFRSIGSKDIHISAGMFNKPVKLKTEMNIFVKKKLEYYKLDTRLPKFNKYPKNKT